MTKSSKLNIEDLKAFASYPREDLERHFLGGELREEDVVLHRARACRDRINNLIKALKLQFHERDEAIEAVVDSLVSSVPAVLIGPPGTAKSRIVREVARLCGLGARGAGSSSTGVYFEYLLTAHTMPEELFGPPDIVALREGRYERRMDGMLPKADMAFLDEVFRGGSHILNTLLSLLNERKFHDGKEVHAVPLTGILAAANFPPKGAEEAALYDRFPVRIWIDSVFESGKTPEDWLDGAQELVNKSSELERQELAGPDAARLQPVACVNDFRLARRASIAWRRKHGTANRIEPFLKLFMRLREQQSGLSDRTLFQLLRVASAEQWRTGSGFEISHVNALAHVADSRDLKRHVETEIDRIANGASLHGHA